MSTHVRSSINLSLVFLNQCISEKTLFSTLIENTINGKLQVNRIKMGRCVIHRGSYISAHVLLNLLNQLGKRDKM